MQNVDVPPGSNALVTGANGFIASNIVEELLSLGYNVIGTVRSATRCAWMTSFFESRAAPHRGTFTLVELPDLADERAFSAAFAAHHIAAVYLTTSNLDFSQTEPEPFLSRAVETITAPMRAALQHPHVKRFVVTGSAFSVYTPRGNDPRALTAETYNDEAVAAAHAAAWSDPAARGMAIFMAAFVAKDRAVWRFLEREKPAFRAAVVLPGNVTGRVLDTAHQGLPTTAGALVGLWEGGDKATLARTLGRPVHYVDVEDCARLHVAAGTRSDVVNERIFAFAEPCTWNRMLRVMKEKWPQRKFDDEDASEGECLAEVSNERGAGLLRDMYGKGWTSLEESVTKTLKSANLV
ncbi:hypothetical protein B0J12DRAFT_360306 [Macrophomina phaseolina]|uniref:NAD-dependent epimerase/dehydratase domain-containing protein n=1 Tax=Macrophomina phaseolina TaxID=35725 RepID=A0ABQ8FU15_9PEZI|nr:hypothetical protein B0J12DRAFT_360306 [Macrophomina phaseolina]